ncbi:MAG: hypothetical protein ACPG4T_11950 [Nannocystaceae bacterium]
MTEAAIGVTTLPFGELLATVAREIAEAQINLDHASILQAEHFAGFAPRRDPHSGTMVDENDHPSDLPEIVDTRVEFGDERLALAALGFVPTFYRFVESVLDLRVDVRLQQSPDGKKTLCTAPIDARYQAKYGLPAMQGTWLRASIVAVPGPQSAVDP